MGNINLIMHYEHSADLLEENGYDVSEELREYLETGEEWETFAFYLLTISGIDYVIFADSLSGCIYSRETLEEFYNNTIAAFNEREEE